MAEHNLLHVLFMIFSGAAILASFILYTRQPILVAYIALGAIIGPYGLNYVNDLNLLSDAASVGIIFLLFLIGLDMQPSNLMRMLKKATVVAVLSSLAFAAFGFCVAIAFGFEFTESLIVGSAMMFSSTIIAIKLLPTTALHHKHTGELVVGLLLLQDLIAIILLLVLGGAKAEGSPLTNIGYALAMLPVLIGFVLLAVKYLILPLIMRFDQFKEYIFLLAIGWCLGIATLAKVIGLSHEIGAFIAGIGLATSPISQYIAERLKPLRDFFLILFFFSLGAGFNLGMLEQVIIPALILAVIVLASKPLVFQFLLKATKEPKPLALEVGFRLGQISEFSLLIAYLAAGNALIGSEASHLIQATAIISFIASTYLVILKYPSPIAISAKLRRD